MEWFVLKIVKKPPAQKCFVGSEREAGRRQSDARMSAGRTQTGRICWSADFISSLTGDSGFVGARGAGLWPLVAERHEEVLTELFGEFALQESLHEDLKALKVNLLRGKKKTEQDRD